MKLTTFENYMQLSVHPNTGKLLSGLFHFGLVGALFMDIAKAERLQVGNEFLVVSDTTSVGIPVVDFIIQKIGTSKEYKKIGYWLPQLAGNKKFKLLVMSYMEDKNLVKIERHPLFGNFFKRYILTDVQARKTIIKDLRTNIISENPNNLLLGLLVSTNLDSLLVTNDLTKKQVKTSCLAVQNENVIGQLFAKTVHKQKLIDLWIGIFVFIWLVLIYWGTQS